MRPTAAGYVTLGVVPAGAGPEQRQHAALRRYAAPWTPLQDAVENRYNDPVAAGPDPGTAWWPTPQDNLVNFPPENAPNYLALQYAPPGSATVAGLPGRPVPFTPNVAAVDGSAPSIGG